MLGQGIYSIPEAARITRLRTSRVREWFGGRASKQDLGPVFLSDYPIVEGDRAISFHDLVELFIAGQLRDKGLTLQRLRKVHAKLSEDWGVKHPFCRNEVRLSQDGRTVFTCGLDEQGKAEVYEVLTNQRVFEDIIWPFLQLIDYDLATKMARRWAIAPGVVIDPAIRFGKPIVEAVGISTAVLAMSYRANGEDARLVADWFDIRPEHVMDAVNFESRHAA